MLAAADVQYRSGAVFYDFHQESNFFYLTGRLGNGLNKNGQADGMQALTSPRLLP